MASRKEIVKFLDETLKIADFPDDPSNNGLQIEGNDEVNRVVCGVDSSVDLFKFAATNRADFVFVHHGMSWKNGIKYWTGNIGKRFSLLCGGKMSLYAAHLPLDAHPLFGNNIVLSNMMQIAEKDRAEFYEYHGKKIGFVGTPGRSCSLRDWRNFFSEQLHCIPQMFGDTEKTPTKVAIVSGAAGDDVFEQAAAVGADFLLTGEMSHQSFHTAKEYGVSVLTIGHYCSEIAGARNVGGEIAKKFGIEVFWGDFPTGL